MSETGTSRGAQRQQDGVQGALPPRLIDRMNARGIRLVQMADGLALAVILVGTMVIRYGWAWPTYPKPLYVASFAITLSIFLASLYFGGLYEREPRLGHPPVLPRSGRQTLAAGGLVALLNLAVTGAAEQLGYETERALPMPILNLVVLIGLGAVAVAANRRISKAMRTNREGPSRVLLIGAPDDLNVARTHLETDTARAVVVGTASDTGGIVARVDETRATDVMLLASGWLDSLYPDALGALDGRGVSVLQRVTA